MTRRPITKQDPQPEQVDAWKLLDDIRRRFTRLWTVRPDMHVTARAYERDVVLALAYPNQDPTEMKQWHFTERNVATMRALADCLLAACDFVESSNPTWAQHPTYLPTDPEEFLVRDDEEGE